MRWIGVIALVALVWLPQPAQAWRQHGRWHQWSDGARERYVAPYALERERATSAAPGRGLVNTLIDESMHEPVLRYAPPPQRTPRPRVNKPHRHHDVRRAAPKRRSTEGERESQPQREVVRREPELPPKVTTPKAPVTEAEKPKPKPQAEAAAPPRQAAASKPPETEAQEPPTRLHGEAAEMQRQREEWLNGITQEHGFERW